MTDALRHRGPDDAGTLFQPGRVALGFRRLSIIDLETGNQPLFDEERRIAVTCNGEIYNFPELRQQLEGRGHRFRTRSDVEVIAHLYEESGLDFVHALQGMFAIALWDEGEQRLVLVRDRLGVKPLYWTERDGGVVYASEPGAIVAGGFTERRPDPTAIMQYLTLQYVPAPRTGFEGMQKLAPGELLVYERGKARVERYWSLPGPSASREVTDEAALAEIDELLRDATRSRLIADVPLGAFLSGGVDSSLVVSYMAEAQGHVKTFSIDVPEAGWSETEHARTVARLYATDHEEFLVQPDMVPTVAEAVRFVGEPFADSSLVPTYLLSRMTRSKVTVALSGDGGDEAFGGYERFLRACQLERLAPVLASPGKLVQAVAPRSLLARAPTLERRLELVTRSRHDRYATMVAHFRPDALEAMCRPDFIAAAGGSRVGWDGVLTLPPLNGGDRINNYTWLETQTYLPGDILTKVDRMSMAHALEVRSPLLDYRVQEFAARLPGRLKLRAGKTKWILKTLALRRGLPASLVERRKMGFGIPVGTWLRGPLRAWTDDLVLSPRALERGYVRPEQAEQLVGEHVGGRVDHSARLWNLAMLELWHRAWIDDS